MTREQATEVFRTKWWVGKSARDICSVQLFEDRLLMPFGAFHEAVEQALGRSVWTHEFASSNVEQLRKEFLGDRAKPSLEEIFNLIPESKRILAVTP